jgi:uncharacterized membrane protein
MWIISSHDWWLSLLLVAITALWLIALVDSARRKSLGWFLFVLLFPGLGLFAWAITRMLSPRGPLRPA